ncbi:MAG TPA: isocitrate lyase/phosphoenolpyruvate mutase family protein [Rhizomicrobium sp.]|nr:isocitrate lyase/phosphoenolpyruvate mutase family protein [Rhizomicrobium sp.]
MTSAPDIKAKADAFYALHHGPKAFIIPNPWDRGTARLLAHLGFKALATTSMGYAFSIGRRDNTLSRDETFANAADLASATDLPVSADLENGFGDTPQDVAETIRGAIATGIVGGSIEDSSGKTDARIYDFSLAAERVEAAVAAAKSLPYKFTLTARAENYLHGRPDLDDTIKRLQAFEKAGADVLYAPGLRSRDDIARLVGALKRPVNVVMGLSGAQLGLEELSAIGVKRISVGSSLTRAALGAFMRAAREMRDHGTFTYGADAAVPKEMTAIFREFETRS